MKIYSKVVIDIESGQIVAEESFDYQGPVARCDLFGGGQAEAAERAGQVQAQAAKYAANLQYKAAQESNQLIREMYQTGRSDLAPWRQTGAMALDLYSGLLGMPSIYETQLPTAQGAQYPSWIGGAGGAGTGGGYPPGTSPPGGAATTPGNYADYGYSLGPSGELIPMHSNIWDPNYQFPGSPLGTGQYQQPQFVGMADRQTPIYSFGGQLFYPSSPYGAGDLYDAFQRSLRTYQNQQAAYKQPPDQMGGPYIVAEPTYGFNPWEMLKYGGGQDITQKWLPYQGGASGAEWIPGYTPGGVTPPAGAGAGAGTGQGGVNALAPYDLSSPSGRIDATEWVKRSPGYEFQLQEGLSALDRSAAARGMLLSGAQQRGITEYGQNYALGHYDTLMNRLASLAGIGQTTSAQTAQLGQNMATQSGQNTMQAAQLAGQARMAGAQAIGSGYINAANAQAQGSANMLNLLGTGFGIGYGLLGPIFSDKRTKEDIEPLNDEAMALVRMLAPVTFRYKAQFGGGPVQPGFIADDLEQMLPGAVLKTPAGMKMVNPLPIIAMLVKAVQEQQQQIDALRRT